jgi:hypothetical protein
LPRHCGEGRLKIRFGAYIKDHELLPDRVRSRLDVTALAL